MKYMTISEFKKLNKEDNYWSHRWSYFKEVIKILKNESFKSTLELGPYKQPLIKDCDVMDLNPYLQNIKYKYDATKTPWPIKDKKYDLFLALQVWEHLQNKQKEAFKEVIRISKMAILSFPLNWYYPKDCHYNITEKIIKEWTLNIKPIKKIIIPLPVSFKRRILNLILFKKHPCRIIYFFKFD